MTNTTTTTDRPLPVDRQTLKRVHASRARVRRHPARAAIGRIDTVIAAVREQLTQRDELDHQLVIDLVGAADRRRQARARRSPASSPATGPTWTGGSSSCTSPATSPATSRPRPSTDDPVHLAWKQACVEVEREWQICSPPTPPRTSSRRSSRSAADTDRAPVRPLPGRVHPRLAATQSMVGAAVHRRPRHHLPEMRTAHRPRDGMGPRPPRRRRRRPRHHARPPLMQPPRRRTIGGHRTRPSTHGQNPRSEGNFLEWKRMTPRPLSATHSTKEGR